ncbi:MotA/TolQ/ExbB proton channel family protein [Sphingopyxis sp. XHP0097]|jgi:biopolymer transport protein ExbB|uniref:Biopolymer transport protein ExbB n=2 Tax=Sphingomonadaceae TaxID=41297 RepID=A0ABS7MFR8_9SPHN|nr:MotA/TolQ/ExbB proton channel family protein [Sphingopyxis lutea]MBY4637519.1 MotA/TolQ/ExbB proton channel family protein [Sphingopyxis jiangsuensis]
MFNLIATAAAGGANSWHGMMPPGMCVMEEGTNPYGLVPALCEGGIVSQMTFLVLLIMFVGTLYILFTKLFEQNKVINQGKAVDANFWRAPTLADGMNKLEKNSAYRQVVEDGLRANEEHTKLTDPVEAHDWMHGTLERSQNHINSKLNSGLAFLATVGSTAPFVGLFGTVIGILRALVKIGASGQASIDTVAGPVGEALIMTAIGLIVAVPAVLAFNWLQSRNKAIARSLSTFANDVLGAMMSGGQVKPTIPSAPAKAAAPAAAPKKA